MGDLLLCSSPVAAVPFYIEGISVNIYSLEELCYYFSGNPYLLDKNFISPELIAWLGDELGHTQLAQELNQILEKDGKLSALIRKILAYCGYCTREKMDETIGIVEEMEEKSDFECNKIRADRLMEKGKYLSCIYEYKRLLDMEGKSGQTPELTGDIWHNLGSAYARMFLFDEALNCFERAYSLNQNPESAMARLFCYKCMQRDIDYMKAAQEYGLDDERQAMIREQFDTLYRGECVEALRHRFEEIEKDGGGWRDYQGLLQDRILQWKEQYRQISRV